MAPHINWQNGLILSPELLKQHDQWMLNDINKYDIALQTCRQHYGIIDAEIDQKLLQDGILKLKYLIWLDHNGLIKIDPTHQVMLNLYETSLEEGRIYLNQYHIETQINGIDVITQQFKLSDTQDLLAQYSFVLCHIDQIEERWELISPFTAMINLTHDLAQPLLYKTLGYLNLIENHIGTSQMLDRRKEQHIKKIKQIKFKINKALTCELPLKTTELFEELVYFIHDVEAFTDEALNAFRYNANNPDKTFKPLFTYFDQWLNLPRKITQIQLYKENNYLISPELSREILKAAQWYLVIFAHDNALTKEWHRNWIKLCAPSRKQMMDNLALPGAILAELNTNDLKRINLSHESNVRIYNIQPGVELDNIIREKRLCCLMNNHQAGQYNYSLHYSQE